MPDQLAAGRGLERLRDVLPVLYRASDRADVYPNRNLFRVGLVSSRTKTRLLGNGHAIPD